MQHDPRCGAILCAAEEELAPFLPHLTEEQRLSRAMLTLHIGRIGGMRMVLAATGMCKVNAALAVQTVLDTISPDFVLNAGTAGGMSYAPVGSLYQQALFSIGLVLFLFIMLINVFLNVFIKKRKED